jgi:hypothetical protein
MNNPDIPSIAAGLIPRDQWYWCGYPGHLIVADRCRFHLHTRVGAVIISTVGDFWPNGESGKRERIGCDRDFETFVFVAIDTERPEGEPLSFSEIDSEGSNNSEESERQHYAMCEKWASAEMQEEAVRAHLLANRENDDAAK